MNIEVFRAILNFKDFFAGDLESRLTEKLLVVILTEKAKVSLVLVKILWNSLKLEKVVMKEKYLLIKLNNVLSRDLSKEN